MVHRNPEDKRRYNRAYYAANRTQINKRDKAYYAKKSAAVKERVGSYYAENREAIVARRADKRRELKIEVLSAYGGCQCPCGETRLGALTIDHVGGGGKKHRQALKLGGEGLYRWLKKNHFPPGFRVLCSNCNVFAHLLPQNIKDSASAAQGRRHTAKLKTDLMALLGGKCATCGKDDVRILTVHHSKHDGAEHRRSVSAGARGTAFYRSVLRAGDVTGLECACFSCNDAIEWGCRTTRSSPLPLAPEARLPGPVLADPS